MSVVNVLTPNGRRQNVKVQPNTAILKVLEDVCEKHKFDPNEYDLKHHKRILDLTTSFRFSGLPNNAQLEMVEAQKKRQDAEVELVVQLSDGTRVEGKFKPNTILLDIIKELSPNELTGDDLCAIYMRTEVSSDKLGSTSLKDLGLISGRAIIRLVHRDPNAAKMQANVALNLTKPSEEKDEKRENKVRKTDDLTTPSTSQSIINVVKEEKKKEQVTEDQKMEEEVDEELASIEEKKLDPPVENMEVNSPAPPTAIDEDEDPGEIKILGERSAVLFMQDAANSANLNLPDSFYAVNTTDLKILIKGLRTEAEGTVEQPLMTAKLRAMEEEQKQLSALNKYNKAIIRILFPNRYVLQGVFTPYETIETVIEFVRSYLANQNIEFYLYTTPPKEILPKESRLFEAKCVPSIVLHFGSEEKQSNYLKEEILDKVSSPKAAINQAFLDRGIKMSSTVESNEEDQPSSSQQPRRSNALSFSSSSTASTSTDVKLPKWFKPAGK
ncbi:tether containing UBX domain for GLUT4 [Contarinia nasturtii]|uniref:tether containing UBX domain for GLUT4 n=1 Tax=Contarinia nasturtii TaxID=265458 RepID=UPI0012D441F1|nr:tether containing UBX domain for GLUT4 [Contarinia nasturtii]